MAILGNRSDGRKRATVDINFESAGSRWAFALLILTIAIGYCWEASSVWVAAEYAASAKPELWRRAAKWEPSNAAYWAQVGSMEAWDFGSGDLDQAARDYERAVEVNPYAERSWLALAGIYEQRGEPSRARAAYERAQHNHPISSIVAWRYANFLLRQGNGPDACEEFRKALREDPRLTEDAVASWWKSGVSESQPITKLLPAENRYYFRALGYFGRENELDASLRVWDELIKLGQHFELTEAISFINEALSADRVREAQRVWLQALKASAWERDASEDSSSLIFNGGFEHDVANGGFDWREQPSADTTFAFDTGVAHSGTRSLRISFDGKSNLDFRNLLEYVPVEPGRRYSFTAYLKSSALSTESGMGFFIADPRRPNAPQSFTEQITGTQSWTLLKAEYVAGPETQLVSIVLRRMPSAKFDNKLSGTVWVDDVRLDALPAISHLAYDGEELQNFPQGLKPKFLKIPNVGTPVDSARDIRAPASRNHS